MSKQEWMDIESAPKDGTRILGWIIGPNPIRHESIVLWDEEAGWIPDYDTPFVIAVSHWMPLPEPPKE